MKYHTPDSPWYEEAGYRVTFSSAQTVAEVWFDSATSAEAAGFVEAGKAQEA